MTQEELDALLENGDIENIEEEQNSEENNEEVYPPPADDKHKVVAQLDEVTKESDKKATEMMDVLENVNNNIFSQKDEIEKVKNILEKQLNIFETLSKNFPHISTFKTSLNEIKEALNSIAKIEELNSSMEEDVMNVMMIMQYQDIHRQKIERVINIMRALIKYMNRLFEGKVEDEERVKTAEHIHGDEGTELVSDDDIEALIAQFGGVN